jgi:isopentenyl-diphosphate delta-isomerase
LELAKAIALGANIGGIAGPFLSAANRSVESVLTLIQEIELELRITMFAAGVVDIRSLANTPLVRKSK